MERDCAEIQNLRRNSGCHLRASHFSDLPKWTGYRSGLQRHVLPVLPLGRYHVVCSLRFQSARQGQNRNDKLQGSTARILLYHVCHHFFSSACLHTCAGQHRFLNIPHSNVSGLRARVIDPVSRFANGETGMGIQPI